MTDGACAAWEKGKRRKPNVVLQTNSESLRDSDAGVMFVVAAAEIHMNHVLACLSFPGFIIVPGLRAAVGM